MTSICLYSKAKNRDLVRLLVLIVNSPFLFLHSFAYSYITMVYTGKPSRGCGMCKSRRIKVSSNLAAFINYSTRMGGVPRQCPQALLALILNCHSAMRNAQHVATARSRGVTARDIRMSLIWYFEMRTKLWLARRRKLPDWRRRGPVLGAQARMLHRICKLIPNDWSRPAQGVHYSTQALSSICSDMQMWSKLN